ncbi:hypothetical protein KAI87_13735, partial [Myxococcota bacterium]|nr:hypothetical protein [Myxococcota bacterium]
SDSEAIEDTTRSVEWSLNMGADMAVIFPLIVKPHTLLHILQKDGRYHSPSLWSLVEVLRRLGPKTLLPAESDKLPRVGMAWYRNYFSTPAVELADTCEKCYPDVIKLLDEYYKWQSYDIIEELDAYSCECHDSWREGLLLPEKPLPERVVQAYDYLAKQVSLDRFWQKRREGFLGELHKEWSAE